MCTHYLSHVIPEDIKKQASKKEYSIKIEDIHTYIHRSDNKRKKNIRNSLSSNPTITRQQMQVNIFDRFSRQLSMMKEGFVASNVSLSIYC